MFMPKHNADEAFEELQPSIEEYLMLAAKTQETFREMFPNKNGLSFADALEIVKTAEEHHIATLKAAAEANANQPPSYLLDDILQTIHRESGGDMGLFQVMQMPKQAGKAFTLAQAADLLFGPRKPKGPDIPMPGKDD